MKKCTRCKTIQIDSGSWCKECTKEYNRNYRKNHKKKLQKLNKQWRSVNAEHYREIKYEYYSSKKGRMVELCKSAAKRAKQKHIEYTLSSSFLEELWSIQEGKCALTRIEFQIPQERTGGKASPFAPSIDRIDCSKGYTPDNVRLVCVVVNYALNEFGEDVFRQICQAYLSEIHNPNKTISRIE
jgi:hypothetical protein